MKIYSSSGDDVCISVTYLLTSSCRLTAMYWHAKLIQKQAAAGCKGNRLIAQGIQHRLESLITPRERESNNVWAKVGSKLGHYSFCKDDLRFIDEKNMNMAYHECKYLHELYVTKHVCFINKLDRLRIRYDCAWLPVKNTWAQSFVENVEYWL